MNGPGPPSLRRPAEALVLLALVVLPAAVYAPVVTYGFVNYDDEEYVVGNPHVRGGLTADGFAWAWTATAANNWHPLTWLSLQLDATLYGPDRAGGYHLTNLVLHTANGVLLFLALRRMTGAGVRSGLVAALFAVHPLHVESVAWVAERKDVLSTLFGMLALVAYAGYVRRQGWGRYLLVFTCLALSLLAKPMLVTLPLVLLLLDYWPLGRLGQGGEAVSFLLLEKVPLLALSVASATVTLLVQRRTGALGLEDWPFRWRVLNAAVACVEYLRKMFWPTDLAVFYPHPGDALAPGLAAGAILLLVTVTLLVVWGARRHGYLPVGWFWYLGTLVPVLGLVQAGRQALADRYTYVPLVGLFLLLTWGGADLLSRFRLPRAVAVAVGGTVLAASAVLAAVQVSYWRDSRSLWEHALAVTADNYVAENGLAVTLARKDELDGAVRHATRAVELRPDFADARVTLGVLLGRQDRLDEAVDQLREAVRLNPRSAEAHQDLGIALHRLGRRQEAAEQFAEAVRLRRTSGSGG